MTQTHVDLTRSAGLTLLILGFVTGLLAGWVLARYMQYCAHRRELDRRQLWHSAQQEVARESGGFIYRPRNVDVD